MQVSEIQKNYKDAIEQYCTAFCEKHGDEYNPKRWMYEEMGGLYLLEGKTPFSIDDIRFDIDNDIPSETLFKWKEYQYRLALLGTGLTVTYKDYVHGFRPYTEAQLMRMRELTEQREATEKEFKELIDSYKPFGIL